jgi:hypothetical protein
MAASAQVHSNRHLLRTLFSGTLFVQAALATPRYGVPRMLVTKRVSGAKISTMCLLPYNCAMRRLPSSSDRSKTCTQWRRQSSHMILYNAGGHATQPGARVIVSSLVAAHLRCKKVSAVQNTSLQAAFTILGRAAAVWLYPRARPWHGAVFVGLPTSRS